MALRAGNLDDAVALYRRAVRPIPTTRITRSRCSARWWPPRARTSRGRASSSRTISSKRRSASTGRPPSTIPATACRYRRWPRSSSTIRDRIEASRPKPAIQEMREQARAASAEPVLNPASRDPLRLIFPNTSLRDILNFIAVSTGINITYDRDVQDRPVTIQSRRRHARAGAQPDHDDEPALVQES